MTTTPQECLDALRKAARRLGESPTRQQYEDLGLQPSQATIKRVLEGWNEAKRQAGLQTFEQGENGGPEPDRKPEWVELGPDEEWDELSGHQRWYRKNREYSRERKRRRRRRLTRWLYEYKRDECECERCGVDDPACLDFHHPDEDRKEWDVSRRVNRGHSIDSIREEIERCVVLCANCHRREHFEVPPESE